MEKLQYTLGVDMNAKDPKTLLRIWADKVEEMICEKPSEVIDSGNAAKDIIHTFIDLDMANLTERYVDELPGSMNHGAMWEDAVTIADAYGLNISAFGLELATVGVHGKEQLAAVLAMLKNAEELKILLLDERPDPTDAYLTANDVARCFEYGLPNEKFLEEAVRLQKVDRVDYPTKSLVAEKEPINLLMLLSLDDFMFNLPSDKMIKDELLKPIAEALNP